jgi:hypothetical protein
MSDDCQFDISWAGDAAFPPFDRWVTDIFDRPDPWTDGGTRRPAGTWRDDVEWMYDRDTYSGDDVLSHIARLFATPRLLDQYSEGQIAEGLEWLCDTTWFEGLAWLCDGEASDDHRRSVIQGVGNLYCEVLARICKDAHPDDGAPLELDRPADDVTFMFWDLVRTPPDSALTDAMEAMFRRVLRIENGMCRAGALHGLGHWHKHQSNRVERIIDEYLSSGRPMSGIERAYAEDARRGEVL